MILGIYGSGGLGREVLELANEINSSSKRWEDILFIDDTKPDGTFVQGIKTISFETLKQNYTRKQIEIIIAVGEPKFRKLLKNKIAASTDYTFTTIIHPTVHIPDSTVIMDGVVIQSHCFISCNVRIGGNTYLQPYAIIGHDSCIGENSVISSFTCIAGHVSIESNTYIGMHVPIKENISIGDNVIIGMGSIVSRDIPGEVIALGNPARPMKKNVEGLVFK